MPGLVSLSSAGALVVAGIAGGVALGHGAIHAINPFFYSEAPSVRAYVPSATYGMQIRETVPVSAEEVRKAVYDPCVGCRTYPVEYQPDHADKDGHAASLGTEYGYRDAAVTELPESAPPQRDPDQVRVVRYASYPVNDDQAKKAQPAGAEQEIEAREDDETLRAAEDKAVPRGPEPLIY